MDSLDAISDPNYMGLRVPADGTLAVVHDGSKYWALAPEDGDPAARDSASERWVHLNYEPVLSMDGKLVDVIAWEHGSPSVWWVLTGRGIVLGAPELMRVHFTDLPMYLVSTPAGYRYLRESPQQLESVCILDWQHVDTNALFQTVWGTILCTSEVLRRKLEARHRECGGEPLFTAVDANPV